ncbi:hypothetical protein CH426_16515 [Klebsiella aerogenes]|nr:hypothetical protein CH426_16515 [Klebsiella aerogenes]
MKNRGRFAAAEKARDQVSFGHIPSSNKCNVVTVATILTKKGEKEKDYCGQKNILSAKQQKLLIMQCGSYGFAGA